MRLHIGGTEVKAGWKILNVQPGPGVDYIGDCSDLSQIADGSVDEIYASHVLEHLGYVEKLPRAHTEFHRVLKKGEAPGSAFRISTCCAACSSIRGWECQNVFSSCGWRSADKRTRTISITSDWLSTFSAIFWELRDFRRSNGRAISGFSTIPA